MTVLRRTWLAVLLVLVWEAASRAAADEFFPPPSRIVAALHRIWLTGPADRLFLTDKALEDFGPSLRNLFLGWGLATVLGVVLGVLLGRSERVHAALDPVLQFGRSVPPPTLIPFLLAVLDLGMQLQVTIIVFGVLWPVLLNTADGVRSVDRLQLDTARVFGITGATRLVRIVLPAAAPKIFAGLRIGLAFGLILVVVSELVGATTGIGAHLTNAQRSYQMSEMWAGIVLLGVLGCLFNLLFHLVERRTLAWHHAARG
ncbi:ABC transporter permease [Actinomadura kijaniata]|uniref:ABC-type nitrate/sulfonate/bicarbonate transport system permease component n=1 Tax=Actinomadura namibiensis TaxID=182080 RepID=A0A7W3QM81_ACTNM|nr:ABC transporter permease [Actinomadura namibiensis]MBA8952241.1 ABC-type nitrate/sulfonate/bicarbonate transport system permease component [Actinomadura namibiensis]